MFYSVKDTYDFAELIAERLVSCAFQNISTKPDASHFV